jgi:beta-lactamase class C
MQRFKIFIGITLLALCLSTVKPIFNSNTEAQIPTAKIEQVLFDHKAIQQYNWHQKELKVAITSYFEKAIKSGDIVGAGVSIVKGDSIIISDGFGKRDFNSNRKVDSKTVFRLGSLSKGFAGVLAASLQNEGKLHWDDKVSDYIPEFQLGDKINTENITLANILSHTSGTPYHSYTNLVEAGLELNDIAKQFKAVEPISKPGLMYSYQNAMFALCGVMMFKATNQDITTLLKNRFFKPLDMDNTSMDNETLIHTENVAMPHVKSRYRYKTLKLSDNYYNAVAAGGINSSASDMGKWMRFLLGYNPEIMNKSAFEDAFNPFIEIKGHSKYYQKWPKHVASYYGYGWRIHKYIEQTSNTEKTILHHGGSVNNYRNEVAIYPEDDLGICVLLNSNSKLAKTVIPDLQKIVKDVYKKTDSKIAINSNTVQKTPAL